MSVRIVFGKRLRDSQEGQSPWAKVSSVEVKRRPGEPAGIQDKKPASAQGAHITGYVVLQEGLARLLTGTDWCDAWRVTARLWVYLNGITKVWHTESSLSKGSARRDELARLMEKSFPSHLTTAREQFQRLNGTGTMTTIPLADAWYVQPIQGEPQKRRAARVYYDSEPAPEAIADGYEAKKWQPNLSGPNVRYLEGAIEEWLRIHNRLPWISVDRKSRVSTDRSAVRAVESAVMSKDTLGAATGMLKCFDLSPTDASMEHATAVAARHVVEHFLWYPGIEDAKRTDVAEAFFNVWIPDVTPAGDRKRKRDEVKVSLTTPQWVSSAEERKRYQESYLKYLGAFVKEALGGDAH